MAGTRDRQANMRAAVAPLRRNGVAATFIGLPGARHGEMSENPERTMADALDFFAENGKVKNRPAGLVTRRLRER